MIIPIVYNTATTVYFPLVTAAGTDFQTTWTPAATESQYILDGGAATDLGSDPAHEGNGIWSQALTAAETIGEYLVLSYSDGATDIEDQAIICYTGFSGQIEANLGVYILECDTATLSPTTGTAEFFSIWPTVTEEATASHFVGKKILITSGGGFGEISDVLTSSLANSKVLLTWTAMVNTLADTDRVVLF